MAAGLAAIDDMKDMENALLSGHVAAVGVPRSIFDRLNALGFATTTGETVKKKFADLGFFGTGCAPAAHLEKVRFEAARWIKVVNNIELEG